MRILIISLFPLELNSSVSISTISIVAGLQSLGHDITIIMPDFEESVNIPCIVKSEIIRFKGKMKTMSSHWAMNKFRSRILIPDYRVHHYLKEAKKIKLPKEYFDIVISFSDPIDSHLFAKVLINRGLQYGKYIQHWGDPLYGNISHRLIWPMFAIRAYENRLFKKTDKVIYVSPFTAAKQSAIHKNDSVNIQFIPLPCDISTKQVNTKSKSSIINIAYIGDYNPRIRNILPLYKACKDIHDVKLTIAGYGLQLEETDNIKIHPRVPNSVAKHLEADADVVVAICNLYGTQIPGKLYYLSNSNKHILVIIEENDFDEMKKYIESFGRYIICSNNAKSITDAINMLRNKKSQYEIPSKLIPFNNASEIIAF